LRCHNKILLSYPGVEIAGYCNNCHRWTIYRRVNIEFEKTRYFVNGKFYAKLLAEDIMRKYKFVTFHDTDEIYVYKDGIYQEGGEALIKEICEEVLQEEATTHRVTEVINHIKRSTYKNRKEIADNNSNFLCVANGILDLRKIKKGKIELLPHTPDKVFLIKLPVAYDENADCPKIKEFIHQIVREEDISIIQEMVGYCLWKRYDIDKAILLVGDGANGKSTLLELIIKLLGKQNVSSIALQDLENNRFAKAELYGKLANIYADLPDKALTHTGIFKMLTGGDLISAERKFKGHIKFVNHAKLIFSCNKVPEVKDDTNAFYRRWIIINFPNKFEGKNADPHVLEKISTPDELSGFLNWALDGLKRLLKNGRFSHSKTTKEMREQYIMSSNPVLAFVEKCVEPDSEAWIEKDELYLAFCNFCKDVGLPIKAKNVFARELPQYMTVSAGRVKEGDERKSIWYGIKLNETGWHYLSGQEDEQDGRDVKDILYFNNHDNHKKNKVRKNLDTPDNPATPQPLTHEDVAWAEMVLKARRDMLREFFINLFMEKRVKTMIRKRLANSRDEKIKLLYAIRRMKKEGKVKKRNKAWEWK